ERIGVAQQSVSEIPGIIPAELIHIADEIPPLADSNVFHRIDAPGDERTIGRGGEIHALVYAIGGGGRAADLNAIYLTGRGGFRNFEQKSPRNHFALVTQKQIVVRKGVFDQVLRHRVIKVRKPEAFEPSDREQVQVFIGHNQVGEHEIGYEKIAATDDNGRKRIANE